MIAEPPPPVPYIVTGLAVRHTLTLLSGYHGEGKSLLATALASGVARGESVAGLACTQGTALVLDAENGVHEIHRRVHTLGLPAEGVAVIEADGFHLGRNLDELRELLHGLRPDLVVLDSFRSLWPGGDENDSAAVAAVLDPLRMALRESGSAGVLLHHRPKGSGDYRGSSAIAACCELGFRLDRAAGDSQRDRRRLRCFKCRPAPEPDDYWLRLAVERGMVFVDAAEPPVAGDEDGDRIQSRGRASRDLAPRLRDLLHDGGGPKRQSALASALGRHPSDGTVRRLLESFERDGEAIRTPDGWKGVSAGPLPECQSPVGNGNVATGNGWESGADSYEQLATPEEEALFERARMKLAHYERQDGGEPA